MYNNNIITNVTIHDKSKVYKPNQCFKLITSRRKQVNQHNHISEQPMPILAVYAPLDQTQPAELKLTHKASHVVASVNFINSSTTSRTSF